ncbi:hypothetical protein Hanom_Chr06g00554091 [Helianthus anomalus]
MKEKAGEEGLPAKLDGPRQDPPVRDRDHSSPPLLRHYSNVKTTRHCRRLRRFWPLV